MGQWGWSSAPPPPPAVPSRAGAAEGAGTAASRRRGSIAHFQSEIDRGRTNNPRPPHITVIQTRNSVV